MNLWFRYIFLVCVKNTNSFFTSVEVFRRSGIPKGIRTPVTAVKGRCPRPLDDRDTKTIKHAFQPVFVIRHLQEYIQLQLSFYLSFNSDKNTIK